MRFFSGSTRSFLRRSLGLLDPEQTDKYLILRYPAQGQAAHPVALQRNYGDLDVLDVIGHREDGSTKPADKSPMARFVTS